MNISKKNDAVLNFESENYLTTDGLIKFCEFRRVETFELEFNSF
jgi:hypothetical protein